MALDSHALIEGLGGIGDILPYSCERSKDNAKKLSFVNCRARHVFSNTVYKSELLNLC